MLVGWSWGAKLGLSFAARYPDRVQALALVGCGTYSEADRELYHQTMARRVGVEGRERMDALTRQLEAAADSVERDRPVAELGQLAERAQSVDLLEDDGAGEAIPVDADGHRETWQDVLRLQEQGFEPAAFSAIRSPVLLLHGEDDPHPGAAIRDTLRPFIPQLEHVPLPRCGHLPWRERHARETFLLKRSRSRGAILDDLLPQQRACPGSSDEGNRPAPKMLVA